jgi:hypothetical protein
MALFHFMGIIPGNKGLTTCRECGMSAQSQGNVQNIKIPAHQTGLENMQQLTHKNYLALCHDATPLIKNRYGDKVLRLSNGHILKLFRIKHLISSARIRSHAIRFALNAARLAEKDIPTVSVQAVYNIRTIRRTAVQYRPIEGVPLSDHLKQTPFTRELASHLANFMARLHARGIYFRAVHFANIIVGPDGGFGLIDIDDMKIGKKALTPGKRLKNFHQLAKYEKDRNILRKQWPAFTSTYLGACAERKLAPLKKRRFESEMTGLFGP